MAENAVGSRILLVAHGLLAEPDASETADALTEWAARERVALRPLPVPAFMMRRTPASGRPAPPQVAERLAELDELESLFEQIAAECAAGSEVIGLVIPDDLTSNRSGRAWLDRVRAIASGIARLQLSVWPMNRDAVGLPLEVEPVRSAS
ncbi:MAG: hypothetical protein QM619_01250 [Micropruina sp.]|uniref:hypothetical protein n=1 Tax=Micropruina sp. TaxID=2737536 RepID=UPI0039E4FC96